MKLQLYNFISCWMKKVIRSHSEPSFAVVVGLSEVVHTVSSSALSTRRNGSSSHRGIWERNSTMWSSQTSALFRLNLIAASVAGRKENHQRTSQSQSIPWRCMSGQELPTAVCIFEGRMNAPLFIQILDRTLLPFIPNVHRFMQDKTVRTTGNLNEPAEN